MASLTPFPDRIRALVSQGLTTANMYKAVKQAHGQGTDAILAAMRPSGDPIETDERLLCLGDPNWPERLTSIAPIGGPWWLWCAGLREPLNHPVTVAIVGTRRASADGLAIARSLAHDLAQCGIAIISGLAHGIDQAAHRGCLEAGGLTVGVLGCGLDVPYPKNADALKRQIITQGALITEQPPGFPIRYPSQFLERNRIIAGLADAVVVIEAQERSGALNTASWAGEYNRECLVVPASPTHTRAKGSLALIRDGCAMVRDADDVLEALGIQHQSAQRANAKPPQLPGHGTRIYELLSPTPTPIDTLCTLTGLGFAEVMSICAHLANEELAILSADGVAKQG